jgi:adenylate cyclase class 2
MIRHRLIEIGASGGRRVFETNIRYEDQYQNLIASESLLRLRKDERSTLTYKCKPPQPDDRFKIHTEIEVEVSDFESMQKILEALGYHREQIYEKWRETYQLDEVIVCLDTLPFGHFVEIESQAKNIQEYADQLELEWSQRIIHNYLELFFLLKKHHELPFDDITFDNFKGITIQPELMNSLLQNTIP